MEGDNLNPYSSGNRPEVEVLSVNKYRIGQAEITVKDVNSGNKFTLPKHNINPETIYEFTPKSFQDVMERNSNTEYRGSRPPANLDTMQLQEKLSKYEIH